MDDRGLGLLAVLACGRCGGDLPVFIALEQIERSEAFLREEGLDLREAAQAVARRLATETGTGMRICPSCKAAAAN